MATTHIDTNVNQLVINKMTKPEYDNLLQVSDTELYLVEESLDSAVTQNSTNPVQSGAVYEALQDNHDVIFCHMLSGAIFNETVVVCTEINGEIFDQQELIDGPNDLRPLFPDGNYHYATNTNKVYGGEIGDNEFIDVTASVMIVGNETKLYCDIDDNKLYRYDGTNFIMVGGGGVTSYNDLTDKPLSVENSKVKYTLSDGTTKLTLAQESDVKDIPISFTPDTSAVRANIQSGDTIAQMAKIVNSNFGFKFINNSDFEFTSYITDANLYGVFFSGLGILIINGWFRLITTDIPSYSNILRFKGYTPISGYPKFIDEYSNNVINFRTGENGKGEWWLFDYRSSTNDIYWEGLPTIIIVYKTT